MDASVILLSVPRSDRVPPLTLRLITRWRRLRSAGSATLSVCGRRTALGGDSAHELMQADFSCHPAAVRRFAEVFLAVHHQRLLAEEDPVVTFTTAEAQDRIQRAQAAIAEFLSVEPEQRTAFAV